MPRDPRPWPRPCAQVLSFEAALGDLDRPFPWDEIEWNRCALQLSTQTGLDEIHNLFSFMSMGQVCGAPNARHAGMHSEWGCAR